MVIGRISAVPDEIPQTSSPAPWQFSLRSLFLFTAALAGLLSTMKILGIFLLPSTILFFVALLMPVWFPLFFLPAQSLRQRLRPLLALIPAGWYMVVTHNEPWRHSPVVWAIGYGLAAVALALSARGRRHLINVPLWLAIVASAVAVAAAL
jgi:hypothetical protein